VGIYKNADPRGAVAANSNYDAIGARVTPLLMNPKRIKETMKR
jgi:hypothetical protein